MKKKKLFILFTISFLTIFVSVRSINAVDLSVIQDSVINTAEAYYAQGEQIQYDSYKKNLNCTPEDATSKHYCYFNCAAFTYSVFKEALGKEIPYTTDDLLDYADCLADGNNSSDCEFKNPKGEMVTAKGKVIGYSVDLKLTHNNNENYDVLLSNFLKQKEKAGVIQKGDIIVWEHTNGNGHVMLVEDVIEKGIIFTYPAIKVFEVGGGDAEGRYDLENLADIHEEEGTVSKHQIYLKDEAFRKTNTSEEKINNRKRVAIIRFATTNDTVSESAKLRDKYKNLDISKVITKINNKKTNNQTFVEAGETITYALKVKNESDNTYKGLKISELIDNNVIVNSIKTIKKDENGEVVSESENTYPTYNKTNIERSIPTLKKNESYTLYYTVQVKTDVPIGAIIKSTGKISNADVGGTIKTSTIETRVGKGLTDDQKTSIGTAFYYLRDYKKPLVGEAINIKNNKHFIDVLYKQAGINFCLNISGIKYNDSNLDEKLNFNNSYKNATPTKYTYVDGTIKKYLYNNFYGLRLTKDKIDDSNTVKASQAWRIVPEYELNDRARTLTPDMLETGDIILAPPCKKVTDGDEEKIECENYYNGYIYIDKALYKFKKEATTFDVAKIDSYKEEDLKTFLRNLIGKKYIILRPYTTDAPCS